MRVRDVANVAGGVLCLVLCACSDTAHGSTKVAGKDSSAVLTATRSTAGAGIAVDTANRTLATATAGSYQAGTASAASGTLRVQISSVKPLPVDTLVKPDPDSTRCNPFIDAAFPLHRGAVNSVGNAVAWLVGVNHGPRDESPRRVNIRIEKCQLLPRVQRVPVGATIIANNRDKSPSDLRFALAGKSTAQTTLHFTESGQVVPSTEALAKPGLVEVRDARHPWLRSYIAVAPHPFVAVTDVDGKFSWDGVPQGNYQLVVWHERMGARVVPVAVKAGQTLDVHVEY